MGDDLLRWLIFTDKELKRLCMNIIVGSLLFGATMIIIITVNRHLPVKSKHWDFEAYINDNFIGTIECDYTIKDGICIDFFNQTEEYMSINPYASLYEQKNDQWVKISPPDGKSLTLIAIGANPRVKTRLGFIGNKIALKKTEHYQIEIDVYTEKSGYNRLFFQLDI